MRKVGALLLAVGLSLLAMGVGTWVAQRMLGSEAAAIGLVDRVTTAADLLPTAHAVARGMGENPQASLKAIKDLITRNASEGDLSAVQQREMAALAVAYRSPEHKEAIAAFMEKRDPNFKAARTGKGA